MGSRTQALKALPPGFEPETADVQQNAVQEPKPRRVNPFDTLPAGFEEDIVDTPYRPPRTVEPPVESVDTPYRPPRTVTPPTEPQVIAPETGVQGPTSIQPAPPMTGVGPQAPRPLRPKGPLPGTTVPLSIEPSPVSAPRRPQIRQGTTVPMDVFSRTAPPPFARGLPMNIPPVVSRDQEPIQPGATDAEFQAAAQQGENFYRSIAGGESMAGRMRELITRGGFQREQAMQTPLVDLSQFAPEDAPLVQGVAQALSGFTSPQAVMTLAATGGLGRLAQGNFGRAVSLGFTADMLSEFPDMGAEFRQALTEQRWDDADRVLGQMMATGGMAGLAGAHAAFGENVPRYRRGMLPELVERMKGPKTGEILPFEEPGIRRDYYEQQPYTRGRMLTEGEPIVTVEPNVPRGTNLQRVRPQPGPAEPEILPEVPRAQPGQVSPAQPPRAAAPPLPEVPEKAVPAPIEKTWIPGYKAKLKPAEPFVEELVKAKEAAEEQRDVARREVESDARTGYGSAAAFKRALPTAELDEGTEIASLDLANLKARNELESMAGGDREIKDAADAVAQAAKELGIAPRVFTPKGDEIYALGPLGKMQAVVDRATDIYGRRSIGKYENYLRGGVGPTAEEADAATVAAKGAETGPKFRKVSKEGVPLMEDIRRVPLEHLDLEPERMQFKLGFGEKGQTGSLEGVKVWNPNLEGIVLAWRDPADGRLKVINGHNRVAKAQSLGVEDIPVKEIDAANASEARAAGALANMAEGHGKPVDVAKFLRDTQTSPEALKQQGIPLRSEMVDRGIALSHLTPDLFGKVVSGEMPVELGAIIGRKLENPDLQTALVKMIRGKNLSGKIVSELADIVANAPRTQATQATLFGDQEITESYAVHKARLLAHVRTEISRDKSLFAKVAKHADRLGQQGIEIPVEESVNLSKEASQALGIFDALKNKVGIIDDVLNESAERIGKGANVAQVTAEATRRIKEALPGIITGKAEPPRPPGPRVTPPTEGPQAAPAETPVATEAPTAPEPKPRAEPRRVEAEVRIIPEAQPTEPKIATPEKPLSEPETRTPESKPAQEPAVAAESPAKGAISDAQFDKAARYIQGLRSQEARRYAILYRDWLAGRHIEQPNTTNYPKLQWMKGQAIRMELERLLGRTEPTREEKAKIRKELELPEVTPEAKKPEPVVTAEKPSAEEMAARGWVFQPRENLERRLRKATIADIPVLRRAAEIATREAQTIRAKWISDTVRALEAAEESRKPKEPKVTIEDVAKGMAEAGERSRQEAEAELIRQGKGKIERRMPEVKGPLFGNEEPTEQGGLFPEEPKVKEERKGYTEVNEPRRRKAKADAERQLNLFDDQFDGKMEVSKAAPPRRGLASGSGTSTVGLALARDLRNRGITDLRGHQIRTAEDLAALAQVFRDPRFETFRIFYLKGDKIVAHEGITSRMPNFVTFVPKGQSPARLIEDIKDRMRRSGADGYYLLHNHPSGKPEPSGEDRHATADLGRKIPGLKAHIVIDHGTYAVLRVLPHPFGQSYQVEQSLHEIKGIVGTPDPMQKIELDHPLLGQPVDDPHAIAGMAIHLAQDPDKISLLLLDAKHSVRAVQEIPVKLYLSPKAFGDHMVGMARNFGAHTGAIVYTGNREDILRVGARHVEENTILDAVHTGRTEARGGLGFTSVAMRARGDITRAMAREAVSFEKSFRVREESPDYRAMEQARIEMPELVELAQAINEGKLPALRRSLGKALGRFRHEEQVPGAAHRAEGQILLRRDIFAGPQIAHEYHDPKRAELPLEDAFAEFEREVRSKNPTIPEGDFIFRKDWLKGKKIYEFNAYQKDENFAPRIMAHEIGHLVDWVEGEAGADRIMSRGNLLGRIAALKEYLKHTLPGYPGGAPALTEQDRRRFQKQARREAPKGMAKDERKQWIKDHYRELIDNEIEARELIENKTVQEELEGITRYWNPFDPAVDPDYTKYRFSSVELYADAFSVLMNEPDTLKRRAPVYWQGLMNYFERKPSVKQLYDEIQGRIRRGLAGTTPPRLERIREMFEEGRQRREELNKRRRPEAADATSWLARQLIDRGWEALKPMKAAVKQGGDLAEAGRKAQYDLEEIQYLASEAMNYLAEISDGVLKPMKKAGLRSNSDDLGAYSMLQRVKQERTAIANPLGFSPTTAKDTLEGLKQELGESKYRELERIAGKWRDLREELIIPRAEASRMYGPGFIQHMRDNRAYVRFGVSHWLDKQFGPGVSARVFKQVGTLSGIENPFIVTVLQDLAVLRAAKLNEAKLSLTNLMKMTDPEHFVPAEMRWSDDEGRRVPVEPRNPRQALMTVIRDGQAEHYYISKAIAEAYQAQPFEATKIAEIWAKMMRPLRAVLVTHNPIWMARNVPRDFRQSVKNLPDVRIRDIPALAMLYRKSFRETWRAIMRGERSEDLKTMARQRMMLPARAYEAREQTFETELERLAAEFEIDTGAVQEAEGARGKLRQVAEALDRLGQVSELTSKLAGYKWLTHGYPRGRAIRQRSMQETGHVVRTLVGTPDVKRRGAAQAITNNVFLFSNVNKEGWRSAWDAFASDKSAYIWKTIALNILPKLMLAAAGAGLAGEFLKRVMAGIPENDKAQYATVPIGLDKNGKSIYLRIPEDYEGQFFGSLVWSLMHGRVTDKGGAINQSIEQVPWGPTKVNPFLKVGGDLLEYYGLGNNPTDEWRGRDVIGEREFEAGGWPAAKDLLKHSWKELGGSVIYDPATNELIPERSTPEEVLRTFPANILGTFLKISDRGIADQLRQVSKEVRQQNAAESIEISNRIQRSINSAMKEKGAPDRGDVRQLWFDLRNEGKIPLTVSEGEFSNRYNRWAARVPANPYVEAIVNATSNKEKERLLMQYRRMLTPAEYEKVIGELLGARTQSPESLRKVERNSQRNEPMVQPGR